MRWCSLICIALVSVGISSALSLPVGEQIESVGDNKDGQQPQQGAEGDFEVIGGDGEMGQQDPATFAADKQQPPAPDDSITSDQLQPIGEDVGSSVVEEIPTEESVANADTFYTKPPQPTQQQQLAVPEKQPQQQQQSQKQTPVKPAAADKPEESARKSPVALSPPQQREIADDGNTEQQKQAAASSSATDDATKKEAAAASGSSASNTPAAGGASPSTASGETVHQQQNPFGALAGGWPFVYPYPYASMPSVPFMPFLGVYPYGQATANTAERFRCSAGDGLYYRDVISFYSCTNGQPAVQYCAPGTMNPPLSAITSAQKAATGIQTAVPIKEENVFCSSNIFNSAYTVASPTVRKE